MAESQSARASSLQPLPLIKSTRNFFKSILDSHRDTSAIVVEAE